MEADLSQNEHSTLEGLMLDQDPTLFQNKNTRYFHICADEAEMHFRCGREITSSYAKVDARPKFFSPQCRMCFKQQSLSGKKFLSTESHGHVLFVVLCHDGDH